MLLHSMTTSGGAWGVLVLLMTTIVDAMITVLIPKNITAVINFITII